MHFYIYIMLIILSAIILILVLVIIKLNIQFYKEKIKFKIKLSKLQGIIIEIGKKQLSQQEQIKLSNDLETILKSSSTKLNNDIFELNYDLFVIATKNNLG